MKEKVIYTTKCFKCNGFSDWVIRSRNVNPMSDKDVMFVINNKEIEKPTFRFCEICKLPTKQEIISFDY